MNQRKGWSPVIFLATSFATIGAMGVFVWATTSQHGHIAIGGLLGAMSLGVASVISFKLVMTGHPTDEDAPR